MIQKALFILVFAFLSVHAIAQNDAYKIFTGDGVEIEYEDMVSQLMETHILFFGELHNDPINHWLQYRLLKDMHKMSDQGPVIGAEMFEADDQIVLDEYLGGTIKEKHFKEESKLWSNYETDYRPLVEYAKENELPFIATNIPRRYAAIVSRKGFEGLESLSERAKEYIAPLPVKYNPNLPGYKEMIKMAHMPGMKDQATENFPRAQAIKDATMAHFILENFKKDKLFIHFNGTYHSKNKEGIVWYIKQEKPGLNIKTIHSVRQENLESLNDKHKEKADYILVVPEDMTNTY